AHGTPADEAERTAIAEVVGGRSLLLAPKAVLGETFAASSVLGLAMVLGAGGWGPGTGDDGVGKQLSTIGTDPRASTPHPILFGIDGPPLDARANRERLGSASLVMVQSLCYSGSVVSLVFTRPE